MAWLAGRCSPAIQSFQKRRRAVSEGSANAPNPWATSLKLDGARGPYTRETWRANLLLPENFFASLCLESEPGDVRLMVVRTKSLTRSRSFHRHAKIPMNAELSYVGVPWTEENRDGAPRKGSHPMSLRPGSRSNRRAHHRDTGRAQFRSPQSPSIGICGSFASALRRSSALIRSCSRSRAGVLRSSWSCAFASFSIRSACALAPLSR